MGANSSVSELGKASTARDVVLKFGAGEYLKGKTAIVTGGNSGIGLENCKALASAGCSVVMCSRSVKAGEAAIDEELMQDGLGGYRLTAEQRARVSVLQLDLNSLASIKTFCDGVKKSDIQIDYLILNAGIMAIPSREETADGFEKQVGVNHFGHAFLVNQLYDKIAADARKRAATDVRYVVLASTAHSMGEVEPADLHFSKGRAYSQWTAYGQSKCCNLLFAKGLAQKLERDQHAGLTAMSVHPGVIKTALWKNTAVSNWAVVSWIADTFIMDKSIPQGAATTLFAALCPEASQKEYRGAYLSDCAIAQPKGSSATSAELVGRLWEETERQLAEKVQALNSK